MKCQYRPDTNWRSRNQDFGAPDNHKSLRDVVFVVLGPTILAGGLAGASGYFLASKSETDLRNRTYLELKLKRAENTTQAFADYVSTWRRLIVQCQSVGEAEDQLQQRRLGKTARKEWIELEDEVRKKQESMIATAKARPVLRDRLMEQLETLRLYFSEGLVNDIDSFITWDTEQQIKTCAELPPLLLFQKHESKIIGGLRKEVTP